MKIHKSKTVLGELTTLSDKGNILFQFDFNELPKGTDATRESHVVEYIIAKKMEEAGFSVKDMHADLSKEEGKRVSGVAVNFKTDPAISDEKVQEVQASINKLTKEDLKKYTAEYNSKGREKDEPEAEVPNWGGEQDKPEKAQRSQQDKQNDANKFLKYTPFGGFMNRFGGQHAHHAEEAVDEVKNHKERGHREHGERGGFFKNLFHGKNAKIKEGFNEIEEDIEALKQDKNNPELQKKLVEDLKHEKDLVANHKDFFGAHKMHGNLKHQALEIANELRESGVLDNSNSAHTSANALVSAIEKETSKHR